jgi:hypothetical protein
MLLAPRSPEVPFVTQMKAHLTEQLGPLFENLLQRSSEPLPGRESPFVEQKLRENNGSSAPSAWSI